jgi:hypothetical protein
MMASSGFEKLPPTVVISTEKFEKFDRGFNGNLFYFRKNDVLAFVAFLSCLVLSCLAGTERRSPVTGTPELHYKSHKRWLTYAVATMPVTAFMLLVAFLVSEQSIGTLPLVSAQICQRQILGGENT